MRTAVRPFAKPLTALVGAVVIAASMLMADRQANALPVPGAPVPGAPVPGAQVPGAPLCPMLPADNVLNTPIDTMPVHLRSEAWKSNMSAATSRLHPDFGPSYGAQSIPYGMPWEAIYSRPKIPIDFYYPSESDPGPYPLGPATPIEGGFEAGGDRHAIVVDSDACILYETYDTHYVSPSGSWAGSGAVWDMSSNALRPAGWTSADAAGLPLLPALLRYDEVQSGEVRHAIRFTAEATDRSYVWPARHHAGMADNADLPPMGARFRLRADFDTSAYGPAAQVVLRAMKTYGLILADNGSGWYFTGDAHPGWESDLLDDLKSVPASQFEAIDASSLMISPDSGKARQPAGQPMCSERPAAPASTGYLAEGATAGALDTWILVANPSRTETVAACLTFFTGTSQVAGPLVTLPPRSRRSIKADYFVSDYEVSTIVDGLTGTVAVERAVYGGVGGVGGVGGAHVGKASATTALMWYLPEGATAGGFETWILVSNPDATRSSSVNLTYMTGAGPVAGPSAVLGPMQRRSFRVNIATYDVATQVTATGPGVVAERATYVSGGSKRGATASPGLPSAETDWFLAEGATAGGFETWILVANPDPAASAEVDVTYMTGAGPVAGPSAVLGPMQRRSFRVNIATYDVSTRVHSDTPVVAERAMYANHVELGQGAASGEAVASPARDWVLVEGATAGGFETWILVANPDPAESAEVGLTYMTGTGPVAGPSVVLGPNSRRSFRVNDAVSTFDVATQVHASIPVVAERSVYAPPGPNRDVTAGPALTAPG